MSGQLQAGWMDTYRSVNRLDGYELYDGDLLIRFGGYLVSKNLDFKLIVKRK